MSSTDLDVASRDFELDRFARLGTWLAMAESNSKDPKILGAKAALRLYVAKQLGLSPWASNGIVFINGQIGATSELKRGIAYTEGFDVVKVEQTADSCTAVVVERATGKELGRATFTLAMAKKAGLVRTGSAWETYPERMLWARAAGWAMKDTIPHVVAGIVSEDEVDEIENRNDKPNEGFPRSKFVPFDDTEHADAGDADFEPVPPSAIDEEEVAEPDSPFKAPAGSSSA